MEVMTLAYCPSCGSPLAPADHFCANCGVASLWNPGYVPYAPMAIPPRNDHTALIVVVVVLAVILALPTVMYVIVSGFLMPPTTTCCPNPFGVRLSRSSDGSNWILTFTSVPTGLSQNATLLTLISASGAPMLPSTNLFLLEGAGSAGVRYVPLVTGPTLTTCSAGDRILVAYGSGTDQYPAGTLAQITNDGSVLYAGTLQ